MAIIDENEFMRVYLTTAMKFKEEFQFVESFDFKNITDLNNFIELCRKNQKPILIECLFRSNV